MFDYRTRVYQREEKALNNTLSASREKWFQLSYEVSTTFLDDGSPFLFIVEVEHRLLDLFADVGCVSAPFFQLEGPLHATVLTLFIQSLAQWEESRLTLLRQLIFLAHVRNASSTPIKQ